MNFACKNQLVLGMLLAWLVIYFIHFFVFPVYETGLGPPAVPNMLINDNVLCPKLKIRKPIKKRKCPKRGIVTAWPGGRMGNVIFEYMTIWAVARKTGLEAVVPQCSLNKLIGIFAKLSVPSLSQIKHCRPRWKSVVHDLKDWNSTSQSLILPVYKFLPELIYPWLNEARKELSLRPALKLRAQDMLRELSAEYDEPPTFVGIHVRRTDYKQYLWNKLSMKLVTADFFHRAMSHFQGKYLNVLFIVVSDDPAWCEKYLVQNNTNVKLASDKYSPSSGQASIDFAILASCNHSIIDYGTYGLWGAILSGGETVMYNITKYHSASASQALPNWTLMN